MSHSGAGVDEAVRSEENGEDEGDGERERDGDGEEEGSEMSPTAVPVTAGMMLMLEFVVRDDLDDDGRDTVD